MVPVLPAPSPAAVSAAGKAAALPARAGAAAGAAAWESVFTTMNGQGGVRALHSFRGEEWRVTRGPAGVWALCQQKRQVADHRIQYGGFQSRV